MEKVLTGPDGTAQAALQPKPKDEDAVMMKASRRGVLGRRRPIMTRNSTRSQRMKIRERNETDRELLLHLQGREIKSARIQRDLHRTGNGGTTLPR